MGVRKHITTPSDQSHHGTHYKMIQSLLVTEKHHMVHHHAICFYENQSPLILFFRYKFKTFKIIMNIRLDLDDNIWKLRGYSIFPMHLFIAIQDELKVKLNKNKLLYQFLTPHIHQKLLYMWFLKKNSHKRNKEKTQIKPAGLSYIAKLKATHFSYTYICCTQTTRKLIKKNTFN